MKSTLATKTIKIATTKNLTITGEIISYQKEELPITTKNT